MSEPMISNLFTLATTAPAKGIVGNLGGESGWMHRLWFRSPGYTPQAEVVDGLFMFILWVCVIAFVVLLVPIVWFPIKYHRSKQATNYVTSPSHHTVLELAWSIIPLLTMVPMFIWGLHGYMVNLAPPSESEEIMVKGAMWQWTPTYRNGAQSDMTVTVTPNAKVNTSPVIYVPVDRPVKLIFSSSDVLHSFFIPDFRQKIDVFPNRYTSMTFTAREVTPLVNGHYVDPDTNRPLSGHVVFCAEYCGTNHAEMAGLIVVLSEEDYQRKVYELATKFPEGNWAEAGKELVKRKGCITCHSADGTPGTGPTWKDMFGDTHKYTDGSTHVVDENWLRENILYAQKRVLEGYPNTMPVFAGQINDKEMDAIIFYIKTLSENTPQSELDRAAEMPPGTDASNLPGTQPPASPSGQ